MSTFFTEMFMARLRNDGLRASPTINFRYRDSLTPTPIVSERLLHLSATLTESNAADKSIVGDLYRRAFIRRTEDSSDVRGEKFGLQRTLRQNLSSATENDVNSTRVDDFHNRFSQTLLQALKVDSVEPGMLGLADSIVSECIKINALAATNWINQLFIANFHRPTIAADLLLLIGRLSYDVANPVGVTMAIGGFNHNNPAVQEAAIRAFENWGNNESLKILTNIQVQPQWLKEYLDEVIADLKSINETIS